jgi:WD40 repeat protein
LASASSPRSSSSSSALADGKRFVTASRDKTVRLWDMATGKPIGEPFRGHRSLVWSAVFSPDGTRVISASEDKTARLWDALTGQQVGELRGHEERLKKAAFGPDGTRIVTVLRQDSAAVGRGDRPADRRAAERS